MKIEKNQSQERVLFGDTKFVPTTFVFSILFYLILQYSIAPEFFSVLTVLDNDDAMRLVSVRDLLNGQSWQDTRQYRVLPPDGISLHWSRLVDLPLAGLNSFFLIFSEPPMAERMAAAVWPALLFITFLSITARTAQVHFGNAAACYAMLAASLMPMLFANFFPFGRVDHHNVQMVLALAICASLIASSHPLSLGTIAGSLAALSLAVGLEMIFFIALAGLILVAEIFFSPSVSTKKLLGFSVSLGLAAPAFYVVQNGLDAWTVRSCDQLSIPVLFLTSSALVYALAVALAHRVFATNWGRLAAGALLTIVFLAATYWQFKPCIAGPYADLPEAIQKIVIGGIIEAASAWTLLSLAPAFALNVLLPLFLVFLLLAGQLARKVNAASEVGNNRALAIISAFLCLGLLGAFWQLRAFNWGLTVLPLAFGATLSFWARTKWKVLPRAKPVVLTAFFIFIIAPQTLTLSGQKLLSVTAQPQPDRASELRTSSRSCGSHAQITRLNQISPTLIMAPLNLGPKILLHTSHSVTAAPYHRSAEALSNGIFPFIGAFEDMAQTAQKYRVSIVLICNQQRFGRKDSAGERLASGDFPDWLQPVDIESDHLTALRVLRDGQGDLLR
ncbi:MAG: hypothetical protein HKP40_06995 [Litoreibacter sp.]|nr:hypothetical protein [Litoreibacter sp.]